MPSKDLFTEYFLLRLLINTVSMILLIRLVYFSTYHKRDSFFTFFILNFIVFLFTYMLEKTGAFTEMFTGLGLLAAFSLLRFRTETISMNDMTYLFIVLTFGLINAVMKATYWELLSLNGLIIGAVFIVDGNRVFRNQQSQTIEYPSLLHIKPADHALLIAELRACTGLDIRKIAIESIDFVKSKASIKIYYY